MHKNARPEWLETVVRNKMGRGDSTLEAFNSNYRRNGLCLFWHVAFSIPIVIECIWLHTHWSLTVRCALCASTVFHTNTNTLSISFGFESSGFLIRVFFYSSWASCLMCSHSIFPISLWCMIDAYMVCHGDSFSVLRSLVCVKLMVDFLIIERKTNVDRY